MGLGRTAGARALRVTLVAGAAFALAPFLGVPSAHACSCASDDDALSVSSADVIFTGTLLAQDRRRDGDGLLDQLFGVEYVDDVVFTFAADRVYKGSASTRQQIRTNSSGASCGLEISGPGPFLVFANLPEADPIFTGPGPELTANLCGGTRPVADGRGVETLGLGRGEAPVVAAPAAAPGMDDGSRTGLVLAASLAGFVALGAALIGRRTLRRRGASTDSSAHTSAHTSDRS